MPPTEQPQLRKMTLRDVPGVLQWIAAVDEEDAAQARQEFAENLDGQYLFAAGERLIGTTGFEPIEGTDGSCWLGWTATAPDARPEDAVAMLAELVTRLQANEVRKVFAETSDPAEAGLRELLVQAGFQEELRHEGYYESGEAMVGLGLRLFPPAPEPIDADERAPRLLDLLEIDDADGTYFVDWEFADEAGPDELAQAVEFARGRGGRVLFASAPSHAVGAARAFEAAGLQRAGRWLDFHEDDVHEEHYRRDL